MMHPTGWCCSAGVTAVCDGTRMDPCNPDPTPTYPTYPTPPAPPPGGGDTSTPPAPQPGDDEWLIEVCQTLVNGTSTTMVCSALPPPLKQICKILGKEFVKKLCRDAVEDTEFGWESCMLEKSETACKSCCDRKGKGGTNTALCRQQCFKMSLRGGF